MSLEFATIVTRSYLPYARALARSLKDVGHVEPLNILVIDGKQNGLPEISGENIRYHVPESLNIPAYADMCIYYKAFELCNALKPFLVSYLFKEIKSTEIIYLDSDIYVVGPFEADRPNKTCLSLTPHHLAPPPLELPYLSEVETVDLGFLNGGYARWYPSGRTEEILAWMQSRFTRYAFADRRRGMFVDQKLLPLLLSYFPGDVMISSDPGLNIAFWNAHERPVRHEGGRYFVYVQPVVFFHLSGYRRERPQAPCAYLPDQSNRHILQQSPWLESLLAGYRQLLDQFQEEEVADYPHTHYRGIRLTPDLRYHYFLNHSLKPLDRSVLRIRLFEFLKRVKRRFFPYRSRAS
jgi:hypothetical protein